jgi:hypothetical protein
MIPSIPKPPTDNIGKFLFISGITIIIIFLSLQYYLYTEIIKQQNKLHYEYQDLNTNLEAKILFTKELLVKKNIFDDYIKKVVIKKILKDPTLQELFLEDLKVGKNVIYFQLNDSLLFNYMLKIKCYHILDKADEYILEDFFKDFENSNDKQLEIKLTENKVNYLRDEIRELERDKNTLDGIINWLLFTGLLLTLLGLILWILSEKQSDKLLNHQILEMELKLKGTSEEVDNYLKNNLSILFKKEKKKFKPFWKKENKKEDNDTKKV